VNVSPLLRGRRVTLARRLAWTLGAMAVLSTALAVVAQDRALARDLEGAAAKRLERSANAAAKLIDEHLLAMRDRYRAIARTPQLRATLELGDAPTLTFLARELVRQQRAELVAFFAPDGELQAVGGDEALAPLAAEEFAQTLLGTESSGLAAVRVPLAIGEQTLGYLVAFERLSADRLSAWSELCGATVVLQPTGTSTRAPSTDALERAVLSLGPLTLAVTSSLSEERAAARHARQGLLLAGGAALLLSIIVCFLLARGMVRPIAVILHAVDRIREGDLDVYIGSARNDEIGDVARGIDRMTRDLRHSRDELSTRLDELDESQQQLNSAQELARVGNMEIDLVRSEVRGSPVFWSLLGISEDRKCASPVELAQLLHPEDRDGFMEAVQYCLESGVAARLDHRVVTAEGSERVIHTQLRVVQGDDGRPRALTGTVQDVTERRRSEEQIRYLAYHDSLTGLGNRLLFKERTELAIARARSRSGRLGVLVLDLDHFKRINDTLGHSVGDELLKEVATRIVRSVRDSDFVGRSLGETDIPVARLGGDEFTVIVEGPRDPSDLASISDRVLASLRRPIALGGHELVISASIGIALWPDDGKDIETLLRSADSAMYHAKSNGRNDYQFYDESMNAAAVHRLRLEQRMRRALERGLFEVHFQPRVELATGRISGFEGLSRWKDEELGSVSPGEFIPLAEQSGLIVPLGSHVLRTVCKQAAAWREELGDLDLRISLNVSARQFRSVDLVREVTAALDESGLSPMAIELEVTESVVLHDEKSVIQTLERLRDMGISIALDDFGTGYSSLSYLRRLPVDVLKIDMSFVRGITRNTEDRELTRAIVAMGKALGLRIVAEGVETVEQRALLESWGCDEIQGFVVSAAEPPERALERLRRERA